MKGIVILCKGSNHHNLVKFQPGGNLHSAFREHEFLKLAYLLEFINFPQKNEAHPQWPLEEPSAPHLVTKSNRRVKITGLLKMFL